MAVDVSSLVEHFFRHEYGRIVSLLAKSLGVREIDLIEDVVQSALSKALQTWARSGVPNEPSAWLYRTARNLAVDAFRRRQTEQRLLQTSIPSQIASAADQAAEIRFGSEIGDESLRLLFLCCHPAITMESRIAFALKTVCGLSVEEIASSLLVSHSSAEKRVTRAKETLRESGTELSELSTVAMTERLDAVQSTLYLMFSEGYAASSGDQSVRADVCDEAIRLTRMLNAQPITGTPSSAALLALMLLQASRMDSRTDASGCVVLLADQDRSLWNWQRIREAVDWMTTAAQGDQLSRYHVESAIAWEHARADGFNSIDWPRILMFYQRLEAMTPGPMIRLNLAIVSSYACSPAFGLSQLEQISDDDRRRLRPWWDCAIADVFFRLGRSKEAIAHLTDALALALNTSQRRLIEQKIQTIERDATNSK